MAPAAQCCYVSKAMEINAPKSSQVVLAILFFCSSATAFQWPENKKSAVSLTSDDGWNSQLLQAAILDARGIKGTFYLTALGMGRTRVTAHAEQWAMVHRSGHEVGNHSFSHWSDQILATKTKRDVAADVGSMEAWLLHNVYGKVPVDHTYAYPQGNGMMGAKESIGSRQAGACEYENILSTMVTGARTLGSGENPPEAIARRRFNISGIPIDGDDATAFNRAKKAIDNGIAKGTWTVAVFHSLGDEGDGYSISRAAYTRIADYLVSRRADLYIAPVVTVKNHILANTPPAGSACALQ